MQWSDSAHQFRASFHQNTRTHIFSRVPPYPPSVHWLRYRCASLSARQATLCHSSILLLESVSEALRAFHVLVDTTHDAAFFARGERLALEAVDARVEALLDEVGVHLQPLVYFPQRRLHQPQGLATYIHEFLHLLLLHAVLELALLGL